MNHKSLIPEFFQSAYKKYSQLQTEEEKDKFLDDILKDKNLSDETLSKHLKEGLLLLSDKVDSLSQKVKAQLPV